MYTECSTVQSLDFNVRHVSSDVGVSEKSGSTLEHTNAFCSNCASALPYSTKLSKESFANQSQIVIVSKKREDAQGKPWGERRGKLLNSVASPVLF